MEAEIVERGLSVPQPTGVHALAELTDAEFERNLAAIMKGQERIKRMQTALLVDGVDYGNVPGVDKPSLGKPGAEKFTLAYNTTAEIDRQLVVGDNVTRPLISYDARCAMHLGSFDGPVIGVGFGTCNSWEPNYRYRAAERVCPRCSKPAIIKGKEEYGGGWLCFAKKGGCSAKFADSDESIIGQQVGQVENPDPWGAANTIMKMAEKRAHVDATLRTFAASGIFTQDMEDNVGAVEPAPAAPPAAAPAVVPIQAASNEPPPISDAELDALRLPPSRTVPKCPVHKWDMRPDSRKGHEGEYGCSGKTSGEWCKERAK
jgi:hypothetical protein